MSLGALPSSITVDDLRLAVQHRPNRRTLEITVERDASLTVKVPTGVGHDEVAGFVNDKRDWIYRKLAQKDALVAPSVTKDFVNGEGFAYLGRSHRLLLVDDQDVDVKLERGRFRMRRDRAATGADVLRRWYAEVGERWLRRRLVPWAARMRTDEPTLRVVDLGYRWGSTRGTDRVNVHWAVLQLRPSLIDYVLVHELAHLSVRNHTPPFWAAVERALPDYVDRRVHLADEGSTVWTGLATGPQTHRVGGERRA